MAGDIAPNENNFTRDPGLGNVSSKSTEYSPSNDGLSKPYLIRPLTPEENLKIEQAVTDPQQLQLTRELLSKEEFQPTNLLTIGERKFFVGKIINSGYLVMFYEDSMTEKLMPRIVDHSFSGRSWRSSPGMSGIISKGTGIHYSQETKPHKNIIRYINWALTNGYEASYQGDVMEDYFSIKRRGAKDQPEFYTFDKEISRYDDKGVLKQFQKYRAGHLSSNEVGKDTNLSEEFRNFDFSTPELKAFLPNFANPPIETDILKSDGIKLETYLSQLNGRPIEWVMAYDREGRVWIERIAFLDREVNSYGVMPEVIDSACLSSKPSDYSEQASSKSGDYLSWDSRSEVDITPLLDNLLPIQQFRKARGIAPYRTPGAIRRLTIENAKNFDELKLALAKRSWEEIVSDSKKSGGDINMWNISLAKIIDKASISEGLDQLPQIPGLKEAVERIRESEFTSISQSGNFNELYKTLDNIGGIQGSQDYFPSWELKDIIGRLRRGEEQNFYVVTGSLGLRDAVFKLIYPHK